jgi:3-hydroxyisobutyrate dehydrogenase-like beta-hydroxyacid dehydrogenase
MKVGVAGLGRMGSAFARRLLEAAYELAVYNRTPPRADEFVERGATRVASPIDLWGETGVVICMVADPQALEDVTLGEGGLLSGSAPSGAVVSPPSGAALIDMSTVSVESSRRVADAAVERGVAYLRAPVSGNPTVVAAGNLSIMVSGDRAAYERVVEVLKAIGPSVFYLGEGEQARVLKLALNLMVAGTAQLMAEALVLGEANGLERGTMLDVMGRSAVGSPFVKYKTPPLLKDDYATTFSTTLMYKDLELVLNAANGAGVPLPVTATVQQLLQSCMSTGMADIDFMSLLPRLRREAGLGPPRPVG